MKSFFLALCLLLPISAVAEIERTVSVRGEGEVKIKPDLAYVQLQVLSKGKDAKSAQEKNAKEMARVEKLLRERFRIEPKDIQTTGFFLNPDYRYDGPNNRQVFLGFQVQHSLSVKVRNVNRVGEVLDAVVGKGAEDLSIGLNGVTFDTEKRKEFEIQALESAMSNAKERAEALAKFGGRKLKGVRRISDTQLSSGPVMPLARMDMMEAKASFATNVQPGEISISSTVAVEYDLE